MYSPKPLTENEKLLLDELLKQISTQAALLAGFTFAILTTIEYQTAPRRSFWFALSATVTIASELLAATLSSSLVFLTKLERTAQIPETFKWQTRAAAISYLLGIITFIVTLDLLIWIRFIAVAPIATIILSIVIVIGVGLLILAVVAHDRISNP